MPLTIMTKL